MQMPTTTAQATAALQQRISHAKATLVMYHPFFGLAVAKRPIQYTADIPTAAMDITGQMYINPAFAEPLDDARLQFLLAHEAMHYMMGHGHRMESRDPERWNIACDAVINDMLIEAKVGAFIEGGVLMPKSREKSSEEVYDELPKDAGSPGGIGSDVLPGGVGPDGKVLSPAELAQLKAAANVELIQATKAAKRMGKVPRAIERAVAEILDVSTPWHQILEVYMSNRRIDDISMSRPNRRFIGANVYIPGRTTTPTMGCVVVGVDTSGSISDREIANANAHVSRILTTCNPEAVHVVYCDSAIQGHEVFEAHETNIRLNARGGGGTNMPKIFDWVEENNLEPDAVIIITDGYTPFGSAPGFDVIWLMTEDVTAPYGMNIRFKEERSR